MTPDINWNVPPDPQEIEQLRDNARLSWAEKLQWLEEAQLMVESLQAAHAQRMEHNSNANQ